MKMRMFGMKGKFQIFEVDIKNESQIKEAFRRIGEAYDGIDLLINNANVITKGLILDDNNTEEMMHIMVREKHLIDQRNNHLPWLGNKYFGALRRHKGSC